MCLGGQEDPKSSKTDRAISTQTETLLSAALHCSPVDKLVGVKCPFGCILPVLQPQTLAKNRICFEQGL